MKSYRFSPLLLLLASLLCLVGAYVSNHYGQEAGVLSRADTARLQAMLIDAEQTAEGEADVVAEQILQKKLRFSTLINRTTYPCFVFKGEKLLYWSDHTTKPEAENVGQNFREKLVEMKFGNFLVLRRLVGQYVILTYVPLERHYGISNRYLREGSERALFRGMAVKLIPNSSNPHFARLYAEEGNYLFSVESMQPNPVTGEYLPLALLLIGFGFYLAGWIKLAQHLFAQSKVLQGALAVVVPLAVFRGGLLYFGLPFSFIELPLFDPKVYAASLLSPSLGDLLINAALFVVAAYYVLLLFRWYGVMRLFRRISGIGPRAIVGMLAIAGFYSLLESLYHFYANTFNNSQLVLDVTQDIQVSGFKILLCLAIILHTVGYLIGFYILAQVFSAIEHPSSKRVTALILLLTALVLLPTWLITEQLHAATLLGITFIFFFVLRLTGIKQLAAVVPYQVYLFIFMMLAISSAVGSLALYEHFDRQLILNKQRVAGNLLVDNDLQGEYLLAERMHSIAEDSLIIKKLGSPFSNQDMVRQKIVKHYLRDYFDKYEVIVTLFDQAGRPVEPDDGIGSLKQFRNRLLRTAVSTDQPNLYLIHNSNSFSSRRYVAFLPVRTLTPGVCTIVLELSLKKITAYSVVPELLIDQKFFQPGLGPELSYAGYENNRLVYSEGDFDYVNRLTTTQLADPRLYTSGLSIGRVHHLAVRGAQHRTVVVTTYTYSFSNWLANFSFLFLLHTFCWLLCVGLYMLAKGRYLNVFRTNFSTKIQLFLNFGIFIPLLVVSIATASQVTDSYKRDLRRNYERRGKAVQENLLKNSALLADSAGRVALTDLADNVASLTETDLNLYGADGNLLVSSQPIIFESGLLSPLMNAQAVASLAERGQPRVLLSEQAGSLSFNALYLPLRAPSAQPGRSGTVIGYVGIPFFDSEKDLDNKLIELISTILNIFTVMFILFLLLTFIASRILTEPLKLITEKLRHTTLTGQNEMLSYQSSDEIGLLVREYNAMLLKLEESKQELATQEKEAAWREMARQVAHEIKNPLTPMKLSLQYLQKAIAERRPNTEELIGKISQTLITQIDVLTDIATSFSTFTNLPAMRPERLDIVPILRRTVELHQGGLVGGIPLVLPDDAEQERYIVYADENLLVRTLNNLLINALQAVPEGRKSKIKAKLEPVGTDRVRICIQDNGTGIPEAVRDKIFVPNFTTKASGSGIGLAVARRGIESAGGRIWFETQEGVGTTFCVELPLAPE
ncbi:sensor histidine kinase [Hymenobacter sp. BT491]|uniref:sensor histidine kinase n=1 Tax=Hymenobacter sp. BT491 TaxID=2766779 RepID=UPI001CA3BB26|nr:HAMP domain-containing sensor histidine kinase [Hymenobacter sp. BT491]